MPLRAEPAVLKGYNSSGLNTEGRTRLSILYTPTPYSEYSGPYTTIGAQKELSWNLHESLPSDWVPLCLSYGFTLEVWAIALCSSIGQVTAGGRCSFSRCLITCIAYTLASKAVLFRYLTATVGAM